MTNKENGYKWVILCSVILIQFALSVQMFAMPVFFPMIGAELHLSMAQLGFVWGMYTLGGLFLAIPGGLFVDRVGIRLAIFTVAFVSAVSVGLRGLATEVVFLSVLMFLAGGLGGCVLSNAPKAIFMWFPPKQLALANGLYWGMGSIGMAVSTSISATIVAPALGGWQNAMYIYGIFFTIAAILWLIVAREPAETSRLLRVPFKESFTTAIRIKDVWLCALAYFSAFGLNVGFVGYLPTYLQNRGWTVAASSLTLTVLILASIVTSILVPALSDRVKLRKIFFIVPGLIFAITVGLLAIAQSPSAVWVLIVINGLGFGALIPILNSIIPGIKGIGAMYAGTATAIGIAIGGLGGWVFATVSGQLAMLGPSLPFIFNCGLSLLTLIPFFFIKETGTRGMAEA